MYPTDHDFIFYVIFELKKNYSHFYESDCNPNKLFVNLNTAKGRLNAPTALGHMLMPLAQR